MRIHQWQSIEILDDIVTLVYSEQRRELIREKPYKGILEAYNLLYQANPEYMIIQHPMCYACNKIHFNKNRCKPPWYHLSTLVKKSMNHYTNSWTDLS